jgi:Rhodopirellula transposase DDE domain
LVKALAEQGFRASQWVVAKLLRDMKYSCQANRKTREGSNHPDRDAQFQHINATVKATIAAGEPAISVDTKKKELIGEFKNNGRELRRQGDPEKVRVHDFKIPELGKVAPYGVYDIAANHGWVSVGIDADTGAFAVESIRRWWYKLGKPRYPNARCLTITADCGGSNGPQVKLWKRELQRLANEIGLKITVTHLPPGTSSRVGDWRGCRRSRPDRCSVSSRRSSNRTCRSPASGFHPRRQAFALGRSTRRSGKGYRPSTS